MEKCNLNSGDKLLVLVYENGNSYNKNFRNKFVTSNIKDCFREYSSGDKVEALKNILVHNEKHTQKLSQTDNIHKVKQIISVKECLQPYEETSFQTIISELRNTVMNSYWNKEVGKKRYQIPNLPIGMNPLEVTFGKKLKSGETMADLLTEKIIESDIPKQNIFEMYKKSHNSYLPAEQIKRHYNKPYDENLRFGKLLNANTKGERLKNLLTWISADCNHSRSSIGEVKDLIDMIQNDNVYERKKTSEILNILSDCPISNEVIVQQSYLQYINSLRQKLKKYIPEISFFDIYEDLLSFDKDFTDILPEDKVFSILASHKIHINKTFLIPLLDLLQIRKNNDIKYEELLNLLNWKYDFPILPKIEKIPLKCQFYNTTYNTTIGNIERIDITNIPTAGISSENLDRSTAYSLILPNIFTKYGLSSTDLSKLRTKQEIKNIFNAIGIQFPNNNFDFLWKKGLEKSNTDNVSVEIFGNLLDQYDDLIEEKDN